MATKTIDLAEPPVMAGNAPARAGLRRVLIKNFVMPCQIGVHAHEHGRTQRVRMSLDLSVRESSRDLEDDLRNVVCYDEIISAVRRLATAGHVRLIETLAERIAELCLNDPRIREARVEVEKLDVYDDVEAVGIVIERVNRQP
jgi:7,8-dihydroneopterin aldolase/epimerase/oxygenase